MDLIVIIQKLEVIKLIHFWGGGGEIRVIETKVAKFAWHSLSFIFLQFYWLLLNKPWNLIGFFVLSVTLSLAGQKMWFRAKYAAIRE